MTEYTSEDYRKYLYAQGALRIQRIVGEMDRLELSDEDDYLLNNLEQIEACLHLTAFEDREAIQKTTNIPGRVGILLTGELKYSDGRAVTTTVFWEDGSETYVWHPDPEHSMNQSGHVIDMDARSPSNRKLIVTGYGSIDMVPG
jgi:heme-degrading monooxygenase HmoA